MHWTRDGLCERVGSNKLFRNPLERSVVVETEIASMDDVIGTGVLGELVKGTKVSYKQERLTKAHSLFSG